MAFTDDEDDSIARGKNNTPRTPVWIGGLEVQVQPVGKLGEYWQWRGEVREWAKWRVKVWAVGRSVKLWAGLIASILLVLLLLALDIVIPLRWLGLNCPKFSAEESGKAVHITSIDPTTASGEEEEDNHLPMRIWVAPTPGIWNYPRVPGEGSFTTRGKWIWNDLVHLGEGGYDGMEWGISTGQGIVRTGKGCEFTRVTHYRGYKGPTPQSGRDQRDSKNQ